MTQSATIAIQAPQFTEQRRKSDTENARAIAKQLTWSFDESDSVVDMSDRLLGYTIEDVAAAMVEAGWIMPEIWRVDWTAVPNDETAATAQLRALLNKDGKHPGRWGL